MNQLPKKTTVLTEVAYAELKQANPSDVFTLGPPHLRGDTGGPGVWRVVFVDERATKWVIRA